MRAFALACAFVVTCAGCSAVDPQTGQAVAQLCHANPQAPPVSFHMQIRPLMDRTPGTPAGDGCKECHYPGQPNPTGLEIAHLDLSTLGTLRKGGVTSGPNVVKPNDPCGSIIVQKLLGIYTVAPSQMPKTRRPWTSDEIQLVVDWIAQGATGADGD